MFEPLGVALARRIPARLAALRQTAAMRQFLDPCFKARLYFEGFAVGVRP
jgi:hypothetical protein